MTEGKLDRREFMRLTGLTAVAFSWADLAKVGYCLTCDKRNREEGRCGSQYTADTPSGMCGNYNPAFLANLLYNNSLGFGPKKEGSDASPRLKAAIPENMTELTVEMEWAHPYDNADPLAVGRVAA